MKLVMVRSPGEELARGERTFVDQNSIDFELAERQHRAYVDTLKDLGCQVEVLPALEGFPDAPFVEDMAIVLPDVAILTRTGAASRRGESATVAAALEAHRPLIAMEAPACLDGGDVFMAESTLFVGQSQRTNHAGLIQLAHLVLEHGFRVKAVEVTDCLHLRTGCSWLGGAHMLINPNWVRGQRLGDYECIEIHPEEPFAATVLKIDQTLLMSAATPRTAERVRASGFEVIELDISEFEKAEAGMTCLSLVFEV